MFRVKQSLRVAASSDGLALLYRRLGKTLDLLAKRGVAIQLYVRFGGVGGYGFTGAVVCL